MGSEMCIRDRPHATHPPIHDVVRERRRTRVGVQRVAVPVRRPRPISSSSHQRARHRQRPRPRHRFDHIPRRRSSVHHLPRDDARSPADVTVETRANEHLSPGRPIRPARPVRLVRPIRPVSRARGRITHRRARVDDHRRVLSRRPSSSRRRVTSFGFVPIPMNDAFDSMRRCVRHSVTRHGR